MKLGIEVEFFLPERPDDIDKGRLYIDEDGKDYIEYRSKGIGHFDLLKVIFATAIDSKEKYSLSNCTIKQSNGNLCRYLVNELYRGNHITKVLENNCNEAEARMTGLTNWLNHSRIIPEINFSDEDSKIHIKNEFRKPFSLSENIKLELIEYCKFNFDKNETHLHNKSSVRFISQAAVSRMELHKNVLAFAGFLTMFCDEPVKLISENFVSGDDSVIEHLSIRELKVRDEYDNRALFTYDKMELLCEKAFQIFYADRDKFMRIIDLFTASVRNSTSEVSFLNITTAFEVIHKEFLERDNEDTRQSLLNELKELGLSSNANKWTQIIRYWHLIKLTEHIDFFKQYFRNQQETVKILRASRNYYTHYTETNDEIWTPNKLFYINKLLRQLLKGIILLQLELPADLINKLLNNRAAVFYQDYEGNEYSVLYLNDEKNDLQQSNL
jgi:hypothetical protein